MPRERLAAARARLPCFLRRLPCARPPGAPELWAAAARPIVWGARARLRFCTLSTGGNKRVKKGSLATPRSVEIDAERDGDAPDGVLCAGRFGGRKRMSTQAESSPRRARPNTRLQTSPPLVCRSKRPTGSGIRPGRQRPCFLQSPPAQCACSAGSRGLRVAAPRRNAKKRQSAAARESREAARADPPLSLLRICAAISLVQFEVSFGSYFFSLSVLCSTSLSTALTSRGLNLQCPEASASSREQGLVGTRERRRSAQCDARRAANARVLEGGPQLARRQHVRHDGRFDSFTRGLRAQSRICVAIA